MMKRMKWIRFKRKYKKNNKTQTKERWWKRSGRDHERETEEKSVCTSPKQTTAYNSHTHLVFVFISYNFQPMWI